MITSLRSSGFKCFADPPPVSLTRVNALYGLNGRGKSSFLQPLLLLSQSLRQGSLNTLIVDSSRALISLGGFNSILCADPGDPHDTICFELTSEGQQIKLEYAASPQNPGYGTAKVFTVDGQSQLETTLTDLKTAENHLSVRPPFRHPCRA